MTTFKVHSEVGLITNSSTVIYTNATGNTVDRAKELINSILRLSDSDKTADDLYDFALEWNDLMIERAFDRLKEDPIGYGLDENMSDEEIEKISIERLNNGWRPGVEEGRPCTQNLVITDKEGRIVRDFAAFLNSIEKEVVYD